MNFDRFNDRDDRLEHRGQAEREDAEKLVSGCGDGFEGKNPATGTQGAGNANPVSHDLALYREFQAAMNVMRSLHGFAAMDMPEYQAAWRAAETIKNRHQGMPPTI